MKKQISALFILITVLLFSLNVSAFEFSVDEPAGLGTEIFNFSGDENNITSFSGEKDVNIFNLAAGGTAYCVKMDSYVMYEFDAPEAGTYTFAIKYTARTGKDRALDYAINDPEGKARVFIDLQESDSEQYVTGTFEITAAGKNQFYVYAPTNMDDDTLKSCDVYNVAVYFTAAAPAAETAAPAAETVAPAETATEAAAPAETAAPEVDAAPQTSDIALSAAAVMIFAGLGVLLCGRKKF